MIAKPLSPRLGDIAQVLVEENNSLTYLAERSTPEEAFRLIIHAVLEPCIRNQLVKLSRSTLPPTAIYIPA